MFGSISGRLLSERPSAAPSLPSQCREWCQNVFLLARFLFLGRARSRMVLNPENKADVDRQEPFFRPKTRGSEARCGTARCRDVGGSHWPIFLVSFSVHRFANVAVRPCNIRSLQFFPLERTLIALCPHYQKKTMSMTLTFDFD